jgi:hypothetical protein
MRHYVRLLLVTACAASLVGTRLDAQSDILLQLESGSPATDRLVVDSAGGLLARGTLDRGTIPATGAGTRLMWYPRKSAFRAGYVAGTQWDDASVGIYSTATGFNTTASGSRSTAMGQNTVAERSRSTAMGDGTAAVEFASTAMGWNTRASGFVSTAMGNGTTASGNHSLAMGYNTTASDAASTAMGDGTTASGSSSTAMGSGSVASGIFSTAIGYNTTASDSRSTAMGSGTTASGLESTAMGSGTTASASRSTAMGWNTTASGLESTAMGAHASTNSQTGAFVYGDRSTTTVMNATSANQFSVRAAGGVRLFTNNALGSGVTLSAGGSSWSVVSDRARKEHFLSVDGEDVLARIRALPVSTWRYIAEEDRTVRHIGPMAQDWHLAFGFSSDSLTINQGDFDGVNLAAVQALDERTRDMPGELARMREENAELRARLERLEAFLHGLTPKP